jgi:transcriptional regulator with XRE-family HTH domain
LSQTALAEKSGVSRRMLVGIEAGETNVSLATLDRVAEALEVAFSDLIQAPNERDSSRINELAWAGTQPHVAKSSCGNSAWRPAKPTHRKRTRTAGASRFMWLKAA